MKPSADRQNEEKSPPSRHGGTKKKPLAAGELRLEDRSLAVFIDDTGHDEFKGDQICGRGGCAVLGRDLETLIRTPWRDVRRLVTGSPDLPLHAHDFGRHSSNEQKETVARFFRTQRFWRIGATLSFKTRFAEELTILQTMKMVLQKRVNDIVERTLCRSVKLIFESSDRADKAIQREFGDFAFQRGEKNIPAECFFMKKASREPALEVADFIANAVGSQGRRNLRQQPGFNKDFVAVFQSVPNDLTSFLNVQTVARNPSGAAQTATGT